MNIYTDIEPGQIWQKHNSDECVTIYTVGDNGIVKFAKTKDLDSYKGVGPFALQLMRVNEFVTKFHMD